MFKKTFRKIDLAKIISLKTGLSQKFSINLINDLLDILNDNIKNGGLNLKNLGTFELLKKKERIGRNPKTKEEHIISQRKTVKFNPSKKMIDELNKFL